MDINNKTSLHILTFPFLFTSRKLHMLHLNLLDLASLCSCDRLVGHMYLVGDPEADFLMSLNNQYQCWLVSTALIWFIHG